MNSKQLAELLNNREYRNELTRNEEFQAVSDNLVIVFGASDDLMEFRGAIHEELDAYEGTTAYLDADGLVVNECDNERCPYARKLAATAKKIKAVWGKDDYVWDKDDYAWVYQTDIPHETFDILDNGEKYCRGIVFSLDEV